MRKARYFVFDPFRLDILDERLWECEKNVRLGHKAFAVLQRLLSQPGDLVTKDELLAAAWPGTAVSDAVLTTAMRELRIALGDQARVPRFIETVHGRGYRFIASVTDTNVPALSTESTAASATETDAEALVPFRLSRVASSQFLVGREPEWAQLNNWFTTVQRGARRIGFVAGEPGIGKTVLVEAFVSEVAARGKARVGRGQCIQQYGAGEAYLPILEALARLGREGNLPIVDLLCAHAPSWLAHLPSLAAGEEFEAPTSVTSERMFRELGDVLEILTARDALILVLEDLHWSDTATLEFLAYIARRRDSARLLILGTYRPLEVLLHKHRLRSLIAELSPYPECSELVLDHLSRESVEAYVLQRCGIVSRLKELAELIHRRTGGHPLFFTTIVDELIRRRILEGDNVSGSPGGDPCAIASVIPSSVRQFIEHRFEQTSGEEQSILEAASVAGDPFSVAALVAATSLPEDKIEAQCACWTRERQFLTADGTAPWPDGTMAARYGFRHALFQEVVYARISPERRVNLHQRIGSRLENAYGKQAASIAAELAMHFDHGRNPQRAVLYLEQAARNALQRSAYSEAGRHLARGKELLEALPEGRARLGLELELSLLLAHVLKTTEGWGFAEVERLYDRARELSEEIADTRSLLKALSGLIEVSYVRAEMRKTQSLASDLLRLARKQHDPVFSILGHTELAGSALALGELTSADKHFREADLLYHPSQHRTHVAYFGIDHGIFSRSWSSHYLWQAGYADQARARAEETLDFARGLAHPFTQTITLAYAAMVNQFRRDVEEVDRLAAVTILHATEHGFPYYLAWSEVLRGWSRAARGAGKEGVAEIRSGIEALQRTAGIRLPYYRALLAEACGWAGEIDEALQALDAAHADIAKTEERWWEPELNRLRGELLLSDGTKRSVEPEACFHRAIDAARGQQAKSLELRAAVSLARLWRDKGKRDEAHRLLTEVHDRFTEGFATADLKDATSLIEELRAS